MTYLAATTAAWQKGSRHISDQAQVKHRQDIGSAEATVSLSSLYQPASRRE